MACNKYVITLGGIAIVLLHGQFPAALVLDGEILHESDEDEEKFHTRQRLTHAGAFADRERHDL